MCVYILMYVCKFLTEMGTEGRVGMEDGRGLLKMLVSRLQAVAMATG